MAKTPSAVVRLAFNAGEISPRLDQRVDLEKANLAARQMENMTMHVHGGARRRPGTKLVGGLAAPPGFRRLEDGTARHLEDGTVRLLETI